MGRKEGEQPGGAPKLDSSVELESDVDIEAARLVGGSIAALTPSWFARPERASHEEQVASKSTLRLENNGPDQQRAPVSSGKFIFEPATNTPLELTINRDEGGEKTRTNNQNDQHDQEKTSISSLSLNPIPARAKAQAQAQDQDQSQSRSQSPKQDQKLDQDRSWDQDQASPSLGLFEWPRQFNSNSNLERKRKKSESEIEIESESESEKGNETENETNLEEDEEEEDDDDEDEDDDETRVDMEKAESREQGLQEDDQDEEHGKKREKKLIGSAILIGSVANDVSNIDPSENPQDWLVAPQSRERIKPGLGLQVAGGSLNSNTKSDTDDPQFESQQQRNQQYQRPPLENQDNNNKRPLATPHSLARARASSSSSSGSRAREKWADQEEAEKELESTSSSPFLHHSHSYPGDSTASTAMTSNWKWIQAPVSSSSSFEAPSFEHHQIANQKEARHSDTSSQNDPYKQPTSNTHINKHHQNGPPIQISRVSSSILAAQHQNTINKGHYKQQQEKKLHFAGGPELDATFHQGLALQVSQNKFETTTTSSATTEEAKGDIEIGSREIPVPRSDDNESETQSHGENDELFSISSTNKGNKAHLQSSMKHPAEAPKLESSYLGRLRENERFIEMVPKIRVLNQVEICHVELREFADNNNDEAAEHHGDVAIRRHAASPNINHPSPEVQTSHWADSSSLLNNNNHQQQIATRFVGNNQNNASHHDLTYASRDPRSKRRTRARPSAAGAVNSELQNAIEPRYLRHYSSDMKPARTSDSLKLIEIIDVGDDDNIDLTDDKSTQKLTTIKDGGNGRRRNRDNKNKYKRLLRNNNNNSRRYNNNKIKTLDDEKGRQRHRAAAASEFGLPFFVSWLDRIRGEISIEAKPGAKEAEGAINCEERQNYTFQLNAIGCNGLVSNE